MGMPAISQSTPPDRMASLARKTFTLSITIGAGRRSQLPQMRGRTMQGLKHAGGFLVRREGLKANPAPLNDKAGNFAGIGENGCHQW
jgi:hypothetical protein